MLHLRSFIFNLLWYINLPLQMIVQSPFYFFLKHENAVKVPKRWAYSSHWLHRVIVGTHVEILGKENLPEGGYLVAAKHQSTWDFYSIYAELKDSSFVLKSELMKIPFFGWYVAKLDHIPIRRADRSQALRAMTKEAKIQIAGNRQILIFPEGTRRAPGADPAYRFGITRLYLELNCPVVPVALNSGQFWPRRGFLRYPGTIRLSFLKPIQPGLSAEEFAQELEQRIEEECDRLYVLGSQDEVPPPPSEAVSVRIAAYKAKHG